ncbi:hypothetical protein [Moritella sp. F3]|uniref:hypothetical protein n=1 Tax=Moritella sp. F3 TaxID=2718882 RepID=UPI0018E1221B|nr:hypothetical protein [Moritella sp. F3]GIC78850.1 hypothetical protein FMO001_35770 [Moritella sp. F1]GIC81915.1 hypothetical protein FMO003_21960 [Moritella sp. F3]
MNTKTLKKIHKTAAIFAFLFITSFLTSTIVADFFATPQQIAHVKSSVLMFIPGLILAMMITGISAAKLYPGVAKGPFKVKQTRMKIAAINGVFILLPAAIVLAKWSGLGQFNDLYWTVQIVEIIAGMVNLAMIGLNIRDGIRLGRNANKEAIRY